MRVLRYVLLLSLLLPACQCIDSLPLQYIMVEEAAAPLLGVSSATQWFQLKTGRWPASLSEAASVSGELAEAQGASGPVVEPNLDAFRSTRFEPVGDSLLRVHFDLLPFESHPLTDDPIPESGLPPLRVDVSRGVLEVPAYTSPPPGPGGTVTIAEAEMELSNGATRRLDEGTYTFNSHRFVAPDGVEDSAP